MSWASEAWHRLRLFSKKEVIPHALRLQIWSAMSMIRGVIRNGHLGWHGGWLLELEMDEDYYTWNSCKQIPSPSSCIILYHSMWILTLFLKSWEHQLLTRFTYSSISLQIVCMFVVLNQYLRFDCLNMDRAGFSIHGSQVKSFLQETIHEEYEHVCGNIMEVSINGGSPNG